jgi:hypothetical protein
MCTVLLPPGIKPIAVNKDIKDTKDTVSRRVMFVNLKVVKYNSREAIYYCIKWHCALAIISYVLALIGLNLQASSWDRNFKRLE